MCLSDAREVYEKDWAAACKTTAKAEKEGYANCMNETPDICKSIWNPKRDASANCALPTKVADRIDSRLEN
jgi:hypothetical protein